MPAPALRQLEGNLGLGPWARQSGDEGEATQMPRRASSSVLSSLHPELELRVNACRGGVPRPLPLHNPRQPDGLVSLEPAAPVGRVRFCAQSLCASVRLSACVCVRAHVLAGGEGSRRPYQLDDVRDAEPVGWLDVLASFHEALVALKPGSTGMRQAPTAAGQHPCPRAGGWEPGHHPTGRKQAPGSCPPRPRGLG